MSSLLQAIPPSVLSAFWPIIAVGLIVAAFWRAFVWLLARIDERFKDAIRSEEFERVVDKRVAAGFEGALRPLLGAHSDLAGKVAIVEKATIKAHERIDAIDRAIKGNAS